MGKNLVIVESPAKAKPIGKYLGTDFTVMASVGHVKDLPEKSFGVDITNDFTPHYEIIPGKTKILSEIRKVAKSSDNIYLAMDPDREGEAIAYHLAEEISGKNKKVYRVLFNEITKNAIVAAFEHPKDLDQQKYESQKARRILDRVVGYQISPLLWEKVKRGLSAGRVQSVAVRLVVDRETIISEFIPEEYWSIDSLFMVDDKKLPSKLVLIEDKKAELKNEKDAKSVLDACQGQTAKIYKIQKTSKKRNPAPPFITSTLQQEAARKLKFTAKKTMMIAQQLYEGVDVNGEVTGLITYMRTDSTRVATQAIEQVREFIKGRYGNPYLPPDPRVYKPKREGQDAHEAIRPTRFDLSPELCTKSLSPEQQKLYSLIWNRFIACQMESAVYDQTAVDIKVNKFTFRANGNVLAFPGFISIYLEGMDDDKEKEDESTLPMVTENDKITSSEHKANQHFTQPPARYTEATLIKALEELGIGRPSTFATIISTIFDKQYVDKEKGALKPTELGKIVTELLVNSFPSILNVEFTAQMENDLDGIEDGKKNWVDTLKNFYSGFETYLKAAKSGMRNVKREEIPTDIKCPTCDSIMNIKWGKNGQFLACSQYPKCTTTKEFVKRSTGKIEIKGDEPSNEICPNCNSKMLIRKGRFGRFLACEKYPDCKTTMSYKTGMKCPECAADLIEKSTKKGTIFFSCISWPKCSFSTWDKPVFEQCPNCGSEFLFEKTSRKEKKKIYCAKKGCDYTRQD